MSKYYIEYGALQANGKRLIECETSALDAKKITEDFAREIADALNGQEAWKHEKIEIEAEALAVGGFVEAARTAEKSSAVGNAAAMREALVKIRDKCVIYNNDLAEEIDALCGNALSAPARNCDIYKNKKDAEVAFLSEECRHPCGNCTVNDKYGCALVHECGVDWLFETATERKGEDDGR